MISEFLTKGRCDEWRDAFDDGEIKRRSYQGVVDANQRNCLFAILDESFAAEFHRLLAIGECLFGTSISRELSHPPVVYRYPVGVGFVPRHDCVTDVELERASSSGQPVIGGDITLLLFLNPPTEYAGGDLYFPDHGV
jgi:PKHD-type hydroxylase